MHYGTGRHHADLPIEGIQKATHGWWFCYLFYCCTMITSKLSIGYFLLRIAIKKLHAWIIYAAMFISVVAGSVFFFVTLFQCHPISYFWNKTQPGTCISTEVIIALAYLYSAFSIISDFTFAILPAFLVMGLQLKRRTKIALVPLLTMGCIASSAVVVRAPFLTRFRSPDFLCRQPPPCSLHLSANNIQGPLSTLPSGRQSNKASQLRLVASPLFALFSNSPCSSSESPRKPLPRHTTAI